MSKLLIVSNRLPVTVNKKKGNFKFEPSVGGLVTGIGSLNMEQEQLWIGWPGINAERLNKKGKVEVKNRLTGEDCHPVFLSKREVENYYYGFSNKTIWPLFHYFTQHTTYNRNLWNAYKRVNESSSLSPCNLILPSS